MITLVSSLRDSTLTQVLTPANSTAAPIAASAPKLTAITPGRRMTSAPQNPTPTASHVLASARWPRNNTAPAMVNSGRVN